MCPQIQSIQPFFSDRILLEDNHLLVINKPSGWLSQGDKTGDADVLERGKAFLKEKYNKPGNVYLAAAHRIDRPVSGVLVLAKTSKAQARLTAAFRDRKVQKTYWALVQKAPKNPTGTLVHHLLKDQRKNVVTAYDAPRQNAKRAELQYTLLYTTPQLSCLEVKPITGRPHQIRVQLARMGCPILGDLKYGAAEALPNAAIALLAKRIVFPHPVGKQPITIEAPLPPGLPWNSIPALT